MPRVAKNFNVADMVSRYQSGESEKKLADFFGVSRGVITNRLINAGVVRRGIKEASKLWSVQIDPIEKRRKTIAAHNAVRGKTQSDEHRAKIAIFNERHSDVHCSRIEGLVSKALIDRGISIIPQKAVGRYNVDIALTEQSIALEIFGGNWHTTFRHSSIFNRRSKYLFDSGWTLIICWVNLGVCDFTPSAIADYAISLQKILRSNPSSKCKHYVIGGDGNVSTINSRNLDYIT